MHRLQLQPRHQKLSRRALLSGAATMICAALAPVSIAWNAQSLQSSMQQRFGQPGLKRLQAWMQILQLQQGLEIGQQLAAINDFWNIHVLAGVDQQIWNEADYWATPIESLGKGTGDCEDFVIGKYFSLIRLGVPAQQMRLIYVRARVGGIGSQRSVAHMVLGFYASPQVDPLVLDNLVGSIQVASQRTDLTPVFSFDAEAVYVGGARSASSDRINRWKNLLVRMRQEGFDV
ncbi:MAG TPA: transglutaminase-like cysteine peptidase [Comamonas sp.]